MLALRLVLPSFTLPDGPIPALPRSPPQSPLPVQSQSLLAAESDLLLAELERQRLSRWLHAAAAAPELWASLSLQAALSAVLAPPQTPTPPHASASTSVRASAGRAKTDKAGAKRHPRTQNNANSHNAHSNDSAASTSAGASDLVVVAFPAVTVSATAANSLYKTKMPVDAATVAEPVTDGYDYDFDAEANTDTDAPKAVSSSARTTAATGAVASSGVRIASGALPVIWPPRVALVLQLPPLPPRLLNANSNSSTTGTGGGLAGGGLAAAAARAVVSAVAAAARAFFPSAAVAVAAHGPARARTVSLDSLPALGAPPVAVAVFDVKSVAATPRYGGFARALLPALDELPVAVTDALDALSERARDEAEAEAGAGRGASEGTFAVAGEGHLSVDKKLDLVAATAVARLDSKQSAIASVNESEEVVEEFEDELFSFGEDDDVSGLSAGATVAAGSWDAKALRTAAAAYVRASREGSFVSVIISPEDVMSGFDHASNHARGVK